MLADDSTISQHEAAEIRAEAERLLRHAGAVGVLPTPVDEIMRAAKIQVVPIALDDGYLAQIRRKAAQAGRALLSALSKVWGVFDPKSRVAFIDPETPKEKLPFLKLHEGGHAVLPWQSIFGMGLVETAEDFGTRAPVPEYRELLDWLAVEFMEKGWSQKQLIRTIVTSAVYQQASEPTVELLEKDPRNVWLARGPRFRADAEVVLHPAPAIGMFGKLH